ncbi:MAG: hypothetical protein K1X57_17175 [Gemmataceae bacterium]|nr:hypothetical protein [Gemmataceae bacterium]
MPRIAAADIEKEVIAVLARVTKAGDGGGPAGLSAHQILARLPRTVREQIVAAGRSRRGGPPDYSSSATLIRNALRRLGDQIEIGWIDARGLHFEVAGDLIQPRGRVCAVYKLVGSI